jgi:hypothetical protein
VILEWLLSAKSGHSQLQKTGKKKPAKAGFLAAIYNGDLMVTPLLLAG